MLHGKTLIDTSRGSGHMQLKSRDYGMLPAKGESFLAGRVHEDH
jgi:hypothetical protein